MRWICSQPNAWWQERQLTGQDVQDADLVTGEAGQTIRGFGACFSELGDAALRHLPQEERAKVMRSLFSPEECGFRFCRLPVGANDFALDWYTPDDTPGDWNLEHFSIERDKVCLIPFIREAKQYSPDLELFASPWSPPAWMKQPPVYNFGTLMQDDRTLDAYARYLVKFLQAYGEAGVEIKRLCPQNEVFADQKFPSCVWSGEQMRDFIRDHLGPAMEKEAPDAEIWLGTINGPFADYVHNDWDWQNFNTFIPVVLKDKAARKYVKGVALQWGGKHVLQHMKAAYPDMPVIQSECECGDGRNDPNDIFYIFELMWLYFRNGAEAFTYWNIALDETARSTWGWTQNSLVTVDRKERTWRFNAEYYIMRHLSHFVPKGSRYVELRGEWSANAMAFIRPDGRYVFQLQNPFASEETVRLSCPGGCTEVKLPPRSLSTIVC